MIVRLALTSDIPAIRALYAQLFAAMTQYQPASFRPAQQAENFVRNNINDSSADFFVAEIDHQVVGFALVQVMTTPPYPAFVSHRYAYLMDISVAPEAQGLGVGTKLVEHCIYWAQVHRLDYIELNVLAENVGAAKLYRKMGFEDVMTAMRLPLDE